MTIDDRFTVHRRDGALVVWCERSGTFAMDVAAGAIETEVGPGGPAEWEHRLACVAIPLLLAERGDLALHASAVATPAGRGRALRAERAGEVDDGRRARRAGLPGAGRGRHRHHAWTRPSCGRA